MDINPISSEFPVTVPQSAALAQGGTAATFTLSADAAASEAYELQLSARALQPGAPDIMPALLLGVYRAPTLSLPLPAAPKRKEAPSRDLFLVHVMAAEAAAHIREYTHEGPSNASLHPTLPATPESITAHQGRMAELSGGAAPIQRSSSGAHELIVQHHLDLIA